jgi:hypothetical protein
MRFIYLFFLFFSLSLAHSQSDSLCNPSFEDSLNNWSTFCNGTSSGNFTIDSNSAYNSNYGLTIDVTNIAPPSSSCALSSCILNLQQGFFYEISFWAKSDSINDLLVVLQPTSAPFTNYASKIFTLSSNWKKYSLYTADSSAVSGVKIKAKPVSNGVYHIDEFNFQRITSLPTNTTICNGDFEIGISNWSNSNNGGDISVFSDSTNFQNFVNLNSARLEVSNTSSGQPIFSSCKTDVKKKIKYKVHFWAKSDSNGSQLTATSSLGSSPFTNFGSETFNITNSWSEFTFISESDSTIYGNVRIAKFKFLNDDTYFLDYVWVEELPIQPYFCDGDFETDLSNWTQTINNGAVASISITPSQAQNGLQSSMIFINTIGTSPGSIQLSSCKTDIVKDSIYTVSFWMKGLASNLGFNAISSLGSSPFTSFSSNSFTTTSNWKEYCFSFSYDSTVIGNVRLLKIQFLDVGTYYLDYATVNPPDYVCSSLTTTSIDDSELNKLKIFPNPSSSVLKIINLNEDINQLSICNINGTVINKTIINNQLNISLDIDQLDNGMYLIHFINKKGVITTQKFIKN